MTDRPLVSIILATFNEKEFISNTIQGIYEAVGEPCEVIVVDDDSPDQTWKLAEAMRDKYPSLKIIRRVDTRGLASAFNRGIIESSGGIVGWMDADMCMPPLLLPRMIALLDEYDIVVGSRYVEGGVDDRHPLRVTASRWINNFANWVLDIGVKDADSGFVVLKREVFNKVTIIPTGYGAYFMEFLYKCKKKGLRIKEVGYHFKDREMGISKSAPSLYRFFTLGMGYVSRIILARFHKVDR